MIAGRPLPQVLGCLLVVIVMTTVAIVPATAGAAAESPMTNGSFLDVSADNVHASAIARLAALGATTGVGDDRFDPDGTLSRGQFASLLAALLQIDPSQDTSRFTDTSGSVHAGAIEALAIAGIVTGTSPTNYSPARPVTRGQVATMLVRVDDDGTIDPARLSTVGADHNNSSGSDVVRRFPDAAGHVFERDLVLAVLLGYLYGGPEGLLHPDDGITRAQAASVLSRFLDVQQDPPVMEEDSLRTELDHGEQLTADHVGLRDQARALTASGPIITQRDGQVIEGLAISVSGRGEVGVLVQHDDVVVRDNRIRHGAGADGIRVRSGTSGTVIEHNVLDAVKMAPTALGHLPNGDGGYLNNNIGSRSIHAAAPATVRRNHILLARSGIRLTASATTVIENHVERLFTAADSPEGASTHGTSISSPGGHRDIVIARNHVVAGASGGIVLYAEGGPQRRIDVVDNLIVGRGEGMGIYGGRSHLHAGHYERNEQVRIDRNRFTGRFGHPGVLGGGTNTAVDLTRPGNSFRANRWQTEGADLLARCGIRQNDCEQP